MVMEPIEELEKFKTESLKLYEAIRKLLEMGINVDIPIASRTVYIFYADRDLPIQLSAKYGIEFTKEPHGDHVDYEGTFEGMTLRLTDIVPKGCRVVYETVEVPARIERRAKIVCNEK